MTRSSWSRWNANDGCCPCLSKGEREVLIELLRRVHGNLDAVKGVGEVDKGT